MRKVLFLALVCVLSLALPLAAGSPVDARWMSLPDGVSVPVPPAEHPRLFLRGRDLENLRGRVQNPVLRPYWENLQRLGERNAENRMIVDALRCLLAPDSALARRTIAVALDTLEQITWNMDMGDVSRPIGRMLLAGAVVYDWCYPWLTREDKEELVGHFIRLAGLFEIGYPIRQEGSLTGHLGEWMVNRDLLSAGVAVYDEYPDMYREAAGKIFRDFIPARNWFYPGGAYHQGAAYGDTRFGSELYPLWIFDRLGAGNVYNPAQQFVPYQWIYMRRPDGRLLTGGDDFIWTPKLAEMLCASYYNDGYILADYLKNPWPFEVLKHANYPMDQLFILLWLDPQLKPWNIAELPLTRYCGPPFGFMYARTGWEGQPVICEMKVNEYNFLNHQHHDAGAFQIYYRGPLAVDSGIYEGNDGGYLGPHNVNYYKRTISHNSLLVFDPDEKWITGGFRNVEKVNDGGQRFPNLWRSAGTLPDFLARDYRTGSVLGHWFGPNAQTPEFSYLKGDITAAYSPKVSQVRRSFVFVNLGAAERVPAALVVFDRVTAVDSSFAKYWLLHGMEEPTVTGDRVTFDLTQRTWSGRLCDDILLPAASGRKVEKVGGPGHEFEVFGRNFPSQPEHNPEEYEMGDWRVQVSPQTGQATDLFLNVLQVTDTGNNNLHKVERIEAGPLVGATLGGRAVLFSRDSERLDGTLRFKLSGNGKANLKVLVADLAAGNWQVRLDGRVLIPVSAVCEESGVLCFEGPAGSYELRR